MKINYFQQGGGLGIRTASPDAAFERNEDRVRLGLAPIIPQQQSVPTVQNKLSNEEVAKMIIGRKGQWAVDGQARKDLLAKEGYDYAAVQSIINKLLKPATQKSAPISKPVAPSVEDKSLDNLIKAGNIYNRNKTDRALNSLFTGINSGVTTLNQYPAMLQFELNRAAVEKDMTNHPENYFGTDQASANALKIQSLNNIEKTLPVTQKTAPQKAVALLKPNNIRQSMGKPLPPMSSPYGWYKQGGQINYFQQGGQVDPVTAVIQSLILNPQETYMKLEQLMQQGQQKQVNAILGEIKNRAVNGDPQAQAAIQALQQVMQGGQLQTQQTTQQTPMAKDGAKLNYFRKLKGLCPEGEEMVYLKKGGCMCQKKKDGGEAKAPKKEFFGKDKKIAKAEGGAKLQSQDLLVNPNGSISITNLLKNVNKIPMGTTTFSTLPDSATAIQRRSKSGNEVGIEKHDNGLTKSFMQGPGLSRPYFMEINKGDTTVTTTGPQLGAEYKTTPSLRQEAINFFNAQDTLPILYKQRISSDAAMYKNGGKTKFFKKAPIAKCGCKARKKK